MAKNSDRPAHLADLRRVDRVKLASMGEAMAGAEVRAAEPSPETGSFAHAHHDLILAALYQSANSSGEIRERIWWSRSLFELAPPREQQLLHLVPRLEHAPAIDAQHRGALEDRPGRRDRRRRS